MRKINFVSLFVLVMLFSSCATSRYYGKYVGTVKAEWLEDGRSMRLLEPLIYVDPKDLEWVAPAGSVVDGASIPQFAWSIIGGPFEGKYRNASVIHDVACCQKLRTWESVHEAFYFAMLSSRVSSLKAKTMYAAVYYFGPRWSIELKFRAVSLSRVKSTINKIHSEVAPGSQVRIINKWIFAYQPKKINITIIVTPPERQLKESDFAKLKLLIEERESSAKGPMLLEEIRNYCPIN